MRTGTAIFCVNCYGTPMEKKSDTFITKQEQNTEINIKNEDTYEIIKTKLKLLFISQIKREIKQLAHKMKYWKNNQF